MAARELSAKASIRSGILIGEVFAEDVAELRYVAGDAEFFGGIVHAEETLVTLSFEPGAEMPVVEYHIELAGLHFFVEERWCTEDRLDLIGEIDIVALLCNRLDQKPALVEGAAGNTDFLAGEIVQAVDLGIGGHVIRAPTVLE